MNGREANQYLTDHKEIVKAVLTYPQLSTLDEDLLQIIRVKLNSMCGSKKKLIGISDSIQRRDSDLQQQCEDPMVTDSLSADVTVSDIVGSLDGQDDWLCVHCSDSAVSNCIECTKCHEWMHWSCENLTEEIYKSHVENPDSEYIYLLCKNDQLNEADDQTLDCDNSTSKSQPVVVESEGQSLSLVSHSEALAQSPDVTLNRPESPTPHHQIEESIVKEPSTIPAMNVLADNVALTQRRISQVQDPDGCDRLSPGSSMCAQIPVSPVAEHPQVCVRHDDEHPHVDTSRSTGSVAKPAPSACAEALSARLEDVTAKEKRLASKDRRLRELQKKFSLKEIDLGDTVDRMEYSKVFITQLENKIKELESSNRILKLRVLSATESVETASGNNAEDNHSQTSE